MINFDAGGVLKVVSGLRMLEQSIRSLADHKPDSDVNDPLHPDARTLLLEDLEKLVPYLAKLNTRVSAAAMRELMDDVKDENSEVGGLKIFESVGQLAVTFRRELSLLNTFCIEPNREHFFSPTPGSYAPDFDVKFPTAVYETDEAGKCLALGRSTATVFHLMRAMEISIKAVARCLGVPDPTKDHERSWGKILETIKQAIDAKTKQGWANASDKPFFADVYVSLDAVRVAWRNTTMHVENKYTEDEAEQIFLSVRGLMRKLTARLDEEGKPLA
jgi:hypothetical protein